MPRSNVVITGLGVVSSIGIGGEAFFDGLLQKRSGITSLANRTDGCAVPSSADSLTGHWIGGPVVDFEPKQYVRPRKSLKVMCREIQTAFAASHLAIEQSGLSALLPLSDEGSLKPADVGTVFGSEMFYGSPLDMEDAIKASVTAEGKFDPAMFGGAAMKKVTPLWMLKHLPNMPACHVGISINAHGPNNTLVMGDVSGMAAVVESISCLERGTAKMMIAGATGTRINTTRMNYRADLPLAAVAEPVELSSRPHDPESQGVVGGEAAAALILERREEAEKREAVVLARIASYASCFIASGGMRGGQRSSKSEPQLRGSAQAMKRSMVTALADAEIEASQVGLVVSHGMGDPVIDLAERTALAEVVPNTPVVATIASLGHSGAASGMVDLVAGALALVKRQVPPTVQLKAANAEIGFRDAPEVMSSNHVLCLSHTSEGNAIAMVLESP
ncbi:3-oxoacyl-ACP synthase [bacterium]|jgi:3-oxoacyl-[acyl-carrier-protein] synthase II|nr:3-oxoacyl-ACP synthase [bacterium]MDC0317548.1 3-oxoacyl-ACP synthase [bacterium]